MTTTGSKRQEDETGYFAEVCQWHSAWPLARTPLLARVYLTRPVLSHVVTRLNVNTSKKTVTNASSRQTMGVSRNILLHIACARSAIKIMNAKKKRPLPLTTCK